MSQTFFTISSLIMVSSMVMYLRELFRGNIRPNPVTWLICLVMMSLNTITYYFVSERNLWAISTPTVITIGVLIVVAYSLVTKQVGKMGWLDYLCFTLALVVGIIWRVTKDDVTANLLMQVVLFISYWPTISGVITGHTLEKPFPWMLGVLVYVFQLAGVLMKDWNWVQLAFPVVNGIIGNGLVVLAILAKGHQTKTSLVAS